MELGKTSGYYERRSLRLAKWVNLLMAVLGLLAAKLSHSDALLLDGLYSFVAFLAAIAAAQISKSVGRRADRYKPFGYEAEEALYVVFRSLILFGILLLALVASGQKIYRYTFFGDFVPLDFGPIVIYTLAMVVLCFGMSAVHGLNLKKSGGGSDILRTERTTSLVDGAMSAAAGGALFSVAFLQGTFLEPIVPIADSLVVILLVLIMIRQPVGLFLGALKEVSGSSITGDLVETLKGRTIELLSESNFTLLDISLLKLGRTYTAVAYIRPDEVMAVEAFDVLRQKFDKQCGEVLPIVRSEIIFTARPPFQVSDN